MNEMANGGFPMFWWIWWFIVAFVVYAGLALWFWKSGSRMDAANRPPQRARPKPGK